MADGFEAANNRGLESANDRSYLMRIGFSEVAMPESANCAGESPVIEILPPGRSFCRGTVVCDCCHQRKSRDEFDEDTFGICAQCIGSDVVAMDIVARFQDDD
ncbi:hypothetical protein EHH54_10330 [Rhizobium leguminosarum]|uniref:hypothetical protein n=1 Tax=Rhizobium TaxID=379 RepID=UPI000FEC2A97|nr:hypothetical protein [Rhizobium leguminosarum]RWX40829.1 hypothetical protein EHH54_10330 [Rhizobium leguminosarum]